MFRELRNALTACGLTFVLCAMIYPAVVLGAAQLLFPHQANGSLIFDRSKNVIGSELIAQPFSSDKYFHPRPSAVDYKADATGGSNLGTKNPDLRAKIAERVKALQIDERQPVPADMVSASGSGLDPDISLEAARYQIERVARARSMTEQYVRALLEEHTNRSGAILGSPPRVNVLILNLKLDEAAVSN